jgi:hydroxyethylthiazole kinase-like uncharacterized protein yjeF
MQPRPWNDSVYSVEQMRLAEQWAIEDGTSVDELMRRAGEGAADWIYRLAAPGSVTVLCGPGNNGGDGYIIAESLRGRGLEVRVVAPLEPTTDAARNARAGWQSEVVRSGDGIEGGTLVDCLFGSGLTRPLTADLLKTLRDLSLSHRRSVAVDVPSGIESDSGRPLNEGLPEYDLTFALGAWKFAHWLLPARAAMGERRLVDIGTGPVPGTVPLLKRPRLDPPALDAHKYTRGFVAVIGGAMPGAGLLAAQAAMRGGAGYVKLFADNVFGEVPADLVVERGIVADLVADPRLDALVVGPGLGRDALARERLEQALLRDLPTVVDGDALMLIEPDMLSGRKEDMVLTPHAGEFARLCEIFGAETGDRFERLRELAIVTRSVIVAKGPDTLIADRDGRITLASNLAAPSWLSIAGTGDVLAGLAGSRIAAGVEASAAAGQAAWLHTRAAQLAGPACVPQDIIHKISTAYAEFL